MGCAVNDTLMCMSLVGRSVRHCVHRSGWSLLNIGQEITSKAASWLPEEMRQGLAVRIQLTCRHPRGEKGWYQLCPFTMQDWGNRARYIEARMCFMQALADGAGDFGTCGVALRHLGRPQRRWSNYF